jgi:DNA-binding IclR family transcriptional regulator
MRTLVLDPGLDRLQALLLEMAEGDELRVPDASRVSGLEPAQCEAVLDALTRAGLMARLAGDAYVRRHLAD